MRCLSATVCLVLLASCSRHTPTPAEDTQQKQTDGATTMYIQGGKGHALLPIPSASNGQPALSLTRGAVTDAITGAEIANANILFKAESESQAKESGASQPASGSASAANVSAPQGGNPPASQGATALPGSTRNVQVEVSNLSGTGWAKVSVFNQGAKIGDLNLVVVDDALNVSIDGVGSAATTPISSTYGNTVAVTLKNNSAEFLALRCSVELSGSVSSCGKIVLPPNASKSIPVDLIWGAYSWTDLIQPSARTADLRLTMQVPPGTAGEMVPAKILPLNLTMQAAGPIWLAILSLIYVGIFLAMGGYLSVLASTVLPNMVRKAELRKHVNGLANRTSSVSTRVDSYLRVLLRLERKKIQVELDNLSGFSPGAAEQFTEISNQIAGLEKRLTVAERMDKLTREFEDRSATAPPSITEGIDKNLDTAAVQLHSFVLNDADVAASNAYLDKAEALLKLLDDRDAQARLIAQNYVQLRNRLHAFPDIYGDLKKALLGIFESLNFGNGNGGTPDPHADIPNTGTGSKPDAGGGTGTGTAMGNSSGAGTSSTDVPAEQASEGSSAKVEDSDVKTDAQGASTPASDAGQETDVQATGVSSVGSTDQPTGTITDPEPSAPKTSKGSANDFSDPKNIIQPMFFAVDHGIAAIQTVLDYAIVRGSVATGASKNCSDPGQDAMKRLVVHECQLLNLLGTMSWKSLRGAITLVQQMREDVYEEDVYQHINDRKAKIVFDTQRARPFLPVFFTLAFDDPRFNGAAALDWVALNWTFPNDLHESGWKICHYFEGNEGTTVGTPRDKGDPSQTRKNVQIKVEAKSPRWTDAKTLETRIEVQPEAAKPEKAGVFAERLRFAIAFGVALAGLKAGALDQLAKLGFVQATVAIIALGFGADTVKNVFTQATKQQVAAAPPALPPAPKSGS